MRRSTFVLQTIFRHSIRLKQTDSACWTIKLIQTNCLTNVEPDVERLTHPLRFEIKKMFPF